MFQSFVVLVDQMCVFSPHGLYTNFEVYLVSVSTVPLVAKMLPCCGRRSFRR